MPFTPGKSGNIKGRPKGTDAAAEAIRRHFKKRDWKEMAEALRSVVINPKASGKDRAACYNALTDRAFGKAIQKVENTNTNIDKEKTFRFEIVECQSQLAENKPNSCEVGKE